MAGIFRKKPKHFDYDLFVIGSGSAGEVAAHIVTQEGKKVAMAEMDTPGGECPNFGCVPTKALLYAAETYRQAGSGRRFGVHADPQLNYHELKKWKDLAVERTGTSHAAALFKAEGIHAIKGRAEFTSPWSVSVSGTSYTARHFLIATGSRPFVPPIQGLEESGYITYREAIDLTKLPQSIFVIGGGAIGCEFSELFSTLGAKVTIAEVAPRLLVGEDVDAGEFLGRHFEEKGIHVFTNTKVVRIETNGVKRTVFFEKNGELHQSTVEAVLLATGKIANTDLNLEAAKVAYDRKGVKTNEYMQTSNKHIFAAGDVVGPYAFTHMAAYQSRLVANNILHPKNRRTAHYDAVPRCVFVEPEIAGVGMTEAQLQASAKPYHVVKTPVSFLGRANTSDAHEGFVKILADKRGKLLGATVVCPRAGEVVHELALAIKHGLKAHDISETIHAYPTWSEAVRYACNKLSLQVR